MFVEHSASTLGGMSGGAVFAFEMNGARLVGIHVGASADAAANNLISTRHPHFTRVVEDLGGCMSFGATGAAAAAAAE
jgi:hypothetical protein